MRRARPITLRKFAGAAATALLLAAVSPALAQPAAPPAPAARAERGPAAQVETRIADLHKRLHITADQEPQFNAFADVMRANSKAMQDLFEQRAQHRDRSATGMMHWYAQLAAAHADDMNKLVPVFDALYGSLSPDQKKAADKEFQTLRQEGPRQHMQHGHMPMMHNPD